MYEDVRPLGVAHTIGDLKDLLDGAIYIAGKDADWIAHEDGEIRIYSEDEEIMVIIEQPPLCMEALLHQDRGRRYDGMTFEDWWEEAATRYGIRCWGIRLDVVKLVAEVAWMHGFRDGCIKTSNLVGIGSASDDAKAGSKAA